MVVFLSKYYFILYRSLCASLNLLFSTPLYILTLSKPLPSLSCSGHHFYHKISTTSPCQISPDDNSTKTNYITTMRFLLTFIFILILGKSLSQDTVRYTDMYGDMDIVYFTIPHINLGQIKEKIFYTDGQIDIRVVYIYKDCVLVRREWWQRGERISYVMDN